MAEILTSKFNFPDHPNDNFVLKDAEARERLGKVSPETEARLRATVGHSSKNLLPITLESGSYTKGGANLSYTVDKVAGTITLNGNTRTSGTDYLTVFSDVNGDVAGKLYLSGGYDDGARLFCRDLTNDEYPKQWDGATTSVTSKGEHDSVQELLIAGHNNEVRLRFYAGYTFNNVVLKPMLRSGNISDDTFEPYVTPTDERIIALEARVAALEAEIEALRAIINGS